jgi:hypothetical protein
MAFSVRVVRNRKMVARFAERPETRGEAHLMVVFTDPELTDREANPRRADAAHRWTHRTSPPESCFEP